MIALPKGASGAARLSLVEFRPLATATILLLGWIAAFGPLYADFVETAWRRDENAHAPFLLAICIGVFLSEFRSRSVKRATSIESIIGLLLLSLLLWLLVFSYETEFDFAASALQGLIAAALIIVFFGLRGLRAFWLPLALTGYLVVWPGWVLDGVTLPLKLHISSFVSDALYTFGLPTAHEGALITVGQYKLLVADACSGVNSMIALTSIGVIYVYAASHLAHHPRPALANFIILASIIPVAYFANIVRVALLVLLTHFFGHDVGQGYLHDLAGLILFATALSLVFAIDAIALAVCKRGNISHQVRYV